MSYPDVDPQPRLPCAGGARPRAAGSATARSGPRSRPARPARTAATSSSSTTGRRSPTACRTTATSSPGYVKDVVPRYQTMRGHRVERRFGWDCHGLPAEVETERQLGLSGRRTIVEYGIAAFNDACRTSVLQYTKEWERYVTRQARWVDFEQRLQDDGPLLHGERHVGVQDALGQGPRLRGLPRAALLLALRDAAVELRDAPRRRLPRPPGPGAHRAGSSSTTAADLPGVDDDAVDAAVQPRPRRRRRHRLRGGRGGRPPLRARRGARSAPTSASSARRHRRRHGARAATSSGAATRRCSRSSPTSRTPSRCSPPTSCAPRRAPASCTWRPGFGEDDQNACAEHGIAGRVPDRRSRPLHRRGAAVGRACTSSTPTRTSSATSRTPASVVRHETYDHNYPHCWRCAGRSSTGRCRPGSCRSPSSATAWSSSTSRSAGCPSTSATAASASGWRTPATGRSAATASGARRSRCGRATTPRYPRIDVYGCLDELERDFGVGRHRPAPPGRRRARAAEPRRPDRPVDDAARPRGARLLVRVGLDAVRAGALPVRERRLVRAPLPGRLHRRVHRPDARLVLHAARAGHGAVRPAGVPDVRVATASCSATTARSCRRACATTPIRSRCSTRTAPTPCAGS